MITLEVPLCRLFFLNEISHEDGMVLYVLVRVHFINTFRGLYFLMVAVSSRMKKHITDI